MTKEFSLHFNAWILRPKPHGTDQMKYFLENNRICIGYPLGESLKDCNYTEIKKLLTQEDEKRKAAGQKESSWIGGLSNVNILVREMEMDDVVVVPHGSDIYFALIKSDYLYVPELDVDEKGSGFPHQREVEWAFGGKPISRNNLPPALRDSLQFPGTAANINKHLETILDMMNESEGEPELENDLSEMKQKSLKFVSEVLSNEGLSIEQRLRAAEILLQTK